MAVYRGQNIRINYGDLELTEELTEAMGALDADCAYGCGGTWEVLKEDPENGVPFRAVFNEMATDELVWNSEAGSWTDGYDEDEDDDDDEEAGDEE
jgi:hypothetical protein